MENHPDKYSEEYKTAWNDWWKIYNYDHELEREDTITKREVLRENGYWFKYDIVESDSEDENYDYFKGGNKRNKVCSGVGFMRKPSCKEERKTRYQG